MADAISAVASVQLGMLQAPEVARETVPLAAQAQIANVQAAAIIARHAQQAIETVQEPAPLENPVVGDALTGAPSGELPSYRQSRRRARRPVLERAIPLAAAHPRGLGSMVDVRA